MLHAVTSSRKQALADPRNPAGGVVVPQPRASTNPPRLAAPTRFEDLPNEIVHDVADHVFKGAVGDQNYHVESLACNSNLQSMLSAELHAGAVLRKIHSAGTFAQLGSALADVPQTSPFHRQGCLIAAIRQLPRLGQVDHAAEPLRAQLLALLPPAGTVGSDGADARDAALLELIAAGRTMGPNRFGFLRLEHVLQTMDADAPVDPAVEAALIRWTKDNFRVVTSDFDHWQRLSDLLVPVAPKVLQSRIFKLFEVMRQLQDGPGTNAAVTMARQMQGLDAAKAAGEPDFRWQLQQFGRVWRLRLKDPTECNLLLARFMARLDPREQAVLVSLGHAPATGAAGGSFGATVQRS